MKNLLFCLVSLIIYNYSIASEIVDLAGEVRIPLPDNWQISGNSGTFPFQIINAEQSAELFIYKSIIDKNEKVKNKRELKESVDIIIKDIILTLPEAKIITNIGKIDDNRAIFSVEFISVDTTSNETIYHRLNSYLYAHTNGEQLLFTIWGKTGASEKSLLDNEILLIQNNFYYYGESKGLLFEVEQELDWKLYALIIFIILLTFSLFKRHKSSEKVEFSEDSHFWRCNCGRQNHNNHNSCKRCGQRQEIKESI